MVQRIAPLRAGCLWRSLCFQQTIHSVLPRWSLYRTCFILTVRKAWNLAHVESIIVWHYQTIPVSMGLALFLGIIHVHVCIYCRSINHFRDSEIFFTLISSHLSLLYSICWWQCVHFYTSYTRRWSARLWDSGWKMESSPIYREDSPFCY